MSRSKRSNRKIKLREKLWLSLLVIVTLSLAIEAWYSIEKQIKQLSISRQQQGQKTARYLSRSLLLDTIEDDALSVQAQLQQRLESENLSYAVVFDITGERLTEVGLRPAKLDPKREFAEPIVHHGRTIGIVSISLDDQFITNQYSILIENALKRSLIIIIFITCCSFLTLSYLVVRPLIKIRKSISENDDTILDDFNDDNVDDFYRIAQRFSSLRRLYQKTKKKLDSEIAKTDAILEQSKQRTKEQVK